MPLDGRPFILVVPHPDDETLAAGVTVAEHAAAGRNVQILLLTRGTGSAALGMINGTANPGWRWGLFHDPATEGYQPLTATTFGAARYGELVRAMGCLGVPADHIHEAGLIDGQVTVAAVKAAILALVATLPPGQDPPGLYAPSHVVDDNPDHRNAGLAIRELRAENPGYYSDIKHYVLPAYWSDARLNTVTQKAWDLPTNATITARARNACRAYDAWAPPEAFAIGYHSVLSMFALMDGLNGNPQPRSMLHR